MAEAACGLRRETRARAAARLSGWQPLSAPETAHPVVELPNHRTFASRARAPAMAGYSQKFFYVVLPPASETLISNAQHFTCSCL